MESGDSEGISGTSETPQGTETIVKNTTPHTMVTPL